MSSTETNPNFTSENSKKVALPAYLVRRCEAFRIGGADGHSYVIRDKLQNKTYDLDPWQFFILEVLPGCETIEKLQSVFKDRYDREISEKEINEFFASLADRHLFDQTALQHPLLAMFANRTYEVVDGKAVPKSYSSMFREDKYVPPPSEPKTESAKPDDTLPGGVQDVPGADHRTMQDMIDLFDPRPILRVVAPILAPVRYIVYAAPALVLIALLLLIERWQLFWQDMDTLKVSVTLGVHLLFSMMTVNIASVILRACIGQNMGAQIERVGIMFFAGFVPRWEIGVRHLDKLSRTQRMWYHGGNLLLRIILMAVSFIVWDFTLNNTGTVANQFALLMILTCWGSLVIETGNPFIRASSYFLLCAYLDEPNLRAKAQKALLNKLHGNVYQASDSNVLAVYGLACSVYVVTLIMVLTLGFGNWLARDLHFGNGAFIISSVICALVWWRYYKVMKQYNEVYHRSKEFDRWRSRSLITEEQAEAETEVKPKKNYYLLYAALICLVLVCMIPYHYNPSGSVMVYPLRKQVIATDTAGLIDHVYFDGGESVKKGAVIATLAHENWVSKIKVVDAQIAAQQAVVDNLKSLPKPQAIAVAEQQLHVAQTQAQYSTEKVPRIEKLYKAGAVPYEELETDRQQAATDVSTVQEKEAALALAKTGPTPDEIAAAESKLSSLKQQKALYEDELNRTILRMPFNGNILTLHLQDRTDSYLNQGDPFCEVEYTGKVTAQVDIEESDLQYVKVGNVVRLRTTAYPDREFDGVVTTIDRNVTTKSTGTYVAIIATFDNPKGVLKTGMTGEAKIDGVTMPVWDAFTQSIQQFLEVEVWSWIP
jgi:multidrug resistance efflux pump